MIPFTRNTRNKPNTFIPVNKSISGSIDTGDQFTACLEVYTRVRFRALETLMACDGYAVRFTSHFIATVWLWFRSNEEKREKKKQKACKKRKKGVSQSPLESGKLAGDNGIIN